MTNPPLVSFEPMPLPASKSQLGRLGERLAAGTPAPGDEELYLAFLDAYDAVQVALVGALRAVPWQEILPFLPPLDIVGRTKTRDTLVEKLRRSPEVKLPYIRDVAGVRIVGDMTLTDQHIVAGTLIKLFGGRIVDRIVEPQAGYRALHAVITFAGLPVEVQVRSRTQHLWPEVFERLADRWGRQIRYAGAPDDPHDPGATDDGITRETRAVIIEQLQELSLDLLASVEKALSDAATTLAGATEEGPVGEAVRQVSEVRRVPPEEATTVREELERVTAPVLEWRRQVEQQLLDLVSRLDDASPSPPEADSVEGP